jgi:hypothetical protein
MCLLDDPDESYDCPPPACRRCGTAYYSQNTALAEAGHSAK